MIKLTDILKEVVTESTVDYSGEYRDLYAFIYNHDLQRVFVDKYMNSFDLTLQNWEDYVRGEIDSDDVIIQELVGNAYKIFYDEDDDMFVITKKKRGKVNYELVITNNPVIIDVIYDSGIHTEYTPRIAMVVDGVIVGGVAYEIDDWNLYNFDIGILNDYQGYGAAKKMIDTVINDATKMGAVGLKAHVVNNAFYEYLINNGFDGDRDGDNKYVYKQL